MAAAISKSPELKEFPDWVLLRPFGRTRCYPDAGAASAAVKDDLTAVEAGTSDGGVAYVSFVLNPAPSISYLDLHWPYDYNPGAFPAVSSIVSVDENHILVSIGHQLRGTDLFVYTAHASSSSPSLRRLPTCDKEIEGLASRVRFLALETSVGILGSDVNDDYVVADLAVTWTRADRLRLEKELSLGSNGVSWYNPPPPSIPRLCTFSSKTGEWAVKELPALQPGDLDHFPFIWTCDMVVPFAGRYLCWVDYYSGLLMHDFSDEDLSCPLSYVLFPGKQYSQNDKIRVDRNFPESFRKVEVSQGVMHFIHIGDDCCQEDTRGQCQTSGLKVTVWSLTMMDGRGNWDVYCVINLNDIWAQPTYKDSSLPHRPLEFPLVIKNESDALCCVLREEECGGKAWILILDMEHSTLKSFIPYTIQEIINNYEAEFVFCKNEPPLVPSGFSKYLNNLPGIQWDVEKFSIHHSKRIKVSNAQEELLQCHAQNAKDNPKILHTSERSAAGVIQAIRHFKLGPSVSPRNVDFPYAKDSSFKPTDVVVKFYILYEKWRRAEVSMSDSAIKYFKNITHPKGVMIHPSGLQCSLHASIDSFRSSYGDKQGKKYRAWVDRLITTQTGSDSWVVRFDFWELEGDVRVCALSSLALSLKPETTEGFVLTHIHKTWRKGRSSGVEQASKL